jgi:hypothetical protein
VQRSSLLRSLMHSYNGIPQLRAKGCGEPSLRVELLLQLAGFLISPIRPVDLGVNVWRTSSRQQREGGRDTGWHWLELNGT